MHSALKAIKGTVFFLPLPMDRTLSDLVAGHSTNLPDPELYVFTDSQPTKERVIWQSR